MLQEHKNKLKPPPEKDSQLHLPKETSRPKPVLMGQSIQPPQFKKLPLKRKKTH